MSSRRKTVKVAAADKRNDGRGWAGSIAWYAFLTLVVLTPLALGVFPQHFGPISAVRTLDNVELPKLVAIALLSGLSLVAFGVSVLRGESKLYWHPVMWVLFGLAAWATLSTLLSASPGAAVLGGYNNDEGLLALVSYVAVAFLAIQQVRSTSALRTVAIVAVVSGLIVSAYAVAQFWGLDLLTYTGEVDRVTATLGNADMLGDYLLFPLALALGLAFSTSKPLIRYVWLAAGAFVGIALLFSGTRGAWLGALAVVLCLVVLNWDRVWMASTARKWAFVGGAVGLVAVITGIVAYTQPLAGRGLSLSSGLTKFSNGRTVIWLTGLRGWLAHPITGWGPDNFGHAFQSAVGSDWYAIVAGLQTAGNAHNLYIQTLVTLGVPGLVLTVWALVQTAIQAVGPVRSTQGWARGPMLAVWSMLVGLMVALAFGVTDPGVSVWLWLTVGLLLATTSKPVRKAATALPVAGIAAGLVMAIFVGSLAAADLVAGWADQQPIGPERAAGFESAARINPLSPSYRWLFAESLVDEAVAAQQAGQGQTTVDALTRQGIAAFYEATAADRGDAMVHVALANVLTNFARQSAQAGSAQEAVQVALDAAKLAPRNPAVLAALAEAYRVDGREADAQNAAHLAHTVAPAYAMQTLGTFGLEPAATP